MRYFLLPAAGLLGWFCYAALRIAGAGRGWLRLVGLELLPVLSVASVVAAFVFPEKPRYPDCPQCFSEQFQMFLFNGLSGLVLALVLLVLELPLALLARWTLRSRASRRSRAGDDEW